MTAKEMRMETSSDFAKATVSVIESVTRLGFHWAIVSEIVMAIR